MNKPETKDRVRLQIPSHPRYVSIARDLVYRLCLQNGFTAKGAFDMKVVSGEALINIIKHAYSDVTDKPIFVEILMYHEYIEVRFRDMGLQIPVSAGLSSDLSDYRERGLGLYLIGKLSDYHFFDQSLPVGTRLTVKKRKC